MQQKHMMMMMHYDQLMTNEIVKIANSHEDIDVKLHIGGGYYLSCTSPFKCVRIRLWKLGFGNFFSLIRELI